VPEVADEYVAETRPDGTVVVRGLPLIAEERPTDTRYQNERKVRKFYGGSDAPRDKKWLERCRAKLLARVRQGFKPPQLFGHTDGPHEAAGHFVPAQIALREVNPGEPPRWTLHADRVFKDQATYERWKKSARYSSPEVSPDYADEVVADAFLEHDPPFNKWAQPKIREVQGTARYRATRFFAAPSLLISRPRVERQASAPSPHVKESRMADEKKPEPEKQAATPAPGVMPAPETGADEKAPGWFQKYMDASEKRHTELMECMRSTMADKAPAAEEALEEVAAEEPGPQSEPAVYGTTAPIAGPEVSRMRSTIEAQSLEIKALREAGKVTSEFVAQVKARELVAKRVGDAVKQLETAGLAVDERVRQDLTEAAHEGEKPLAREVSRWKALASSSTTQHEIYGHGSQVEGSGELDEVVEAIPAELEELRKKGGKFAAAANERYATWKKLDPYIQRDAFGGDFKNFLYARGPQGQLVLKGSSASQNGRG
jgi:hypothetical protein